MGHVFKVDNQALGIIASFDDLRHFYSLFAFCDTRQLLDTTGHLTGLLFGRKHSRDPSRKSLFCWPIED